MVKAISEADQVSVAKAREAGQDHIFAGWDELSPEDQRHLIAQVEGIDFQLVKRLIQEHLAAGRKPAEESVLKPAPAVRLADLASRPEDLALLKTLGEYALRQGEVAIVTAAGSGPLPEPLALVPVGPVSGKSLLQLHAEKIHALQRRYRASFRWLIFSNLEDRSRIAAYLKANGWFGLRCPDISILTQDLLPVFDRRGKFLLCGPGRIAMSPNGHGGILLRLLDPESLKAFTDGGIRYVFYFQVDNPLVKIADPVFLGLHIREQAEVSTKAVRRVDPGEAVGVICLANGALGVVEHTEIAEEDRQRTLPDGSLALSAANTGIHVFSVEFLQEMASSGVHLPYHAVRRATPCIDRRGRQVRPSEPNSILFKTFIFDAIRKAQRTTILEVEREEEFSPIRNAGGACSPLTAQRDLSRMYARWLQEACLECPAGAGTDVGPSVEISPLYALDVDELKEKIGLPFPGNGNILLGGRS